MTISEQLFIDKLISLAVGEVGYTEEEGNRNKYAAYLDTLPGFYNGAKNGFAWCECFVDWCFVKAFGVETGKHLLCGNANGAGAGCIGSAQAYRDSGHWYSKPQIGDQAFFGSYKQENHTGIVIDVADGYVTTVEGNTSDRVLRRKYALTDGSIVGYGRPRWEILTDTATTPAVQNPTATPAPASSSAPTSTKQNTKQSMKRADIEWLQKICIENGYDCVEIDGECGYNTFFAAFDMLIAEVEKIYGITDRVKILKVFVEEIRKWT